MHPTSRDERDHSRLPGQECRDALIIEEHARGSGGIAPLSAFGCWAGTNSRRPPIRRLPGQTGDDAEYPGHAAPVHEDLSARAGIARPA